MIHIIKLLRHLQKCAPFPWDAVLSGGSGVLGAATSIYKTARVNAANKAINDANLKFQREQMARAEMYNNPAMQKMRLQNAGLNPSLVAGAGSSTPLTAPSSIPMQNTPDLSSYFHQIGGSIGSFIDNEYKKKLIEGQAFQNQITGIDASVHADKAAQDLREQLSRIDKDSKQAELLKHQIDKYDKLADSQIVLLDEQAITEREKQRNLFVNSVEMEHNTVRLDKESAARVKSMSVADAVSWFNAHTARNSSDSQIRIDDKQVIQLQNSINEFNQTKNARMLYQELQNLSAGMDFAQKYSLAQIVAIQLSNAKKTSSSLIGDVIRYGFGIDPSSILNTVVSGLLK